MKDKKSINDGCRPQVIRLDREEFYDELVHFLGGKTVGKFLYILAYENEVLAVSPYRDEVDRLREAHISE